MPSSSQPTRPAAEAQPLIARPEFGDWVLAPEDGDLGDTRVTPDGSRAFILRGTRWLDHPDGSIERAQQVFQEEEVKATALPAHLGGGFLFYANAGTATSLWRADDWLADLRPLGRVEPPVSDITPGFDRLYLASAIHHGLRALDPFTGQALDLAPLPAAAAYGDMIFADPWNAVVLASVRGALATFDAGESWYPLRTPAPVNELGLTPAGGITLGTDAGRFELDPMARLVPTSAEGQDALFASANTFTRYPREAFPVPVPEPSAASRPLGRRPLRAAVLRGFPDTPSSAVLIEQGVLGRVRLADGKLLSSVPFAGVGPCRGVALGLGFGFVCGDVEGPTEIYVYAHERLRLELTLDGPHAVRSSSNGGLVIAAPCASVRFAPDAPSRRRPKRTAVFAASGSEAGAAVTRYCARQLTGDLLDVSVEGQAGTERVALLRDGRVAVLFPPRSNTPGRLLLLSGAGTKSVELELQPETGPGAQLVRSGLWLDELGELADGRLGSWVVGAQAFTGVQIDSKGVVAIARLQDGVDETSFFGGNALQVAASASLRETTDYGLTWRVSNMPPAVLTGSVGSKARRPLRGCSSVGCVYEDWVRIGYASERGVPAPARPEPPARVRHDAPGFAFWTLDCAPAAGDARAAQARQRHASNVSDAASAGERPDSARARPATEPPDSSAWFSFQAEAPPRLRPGDVAYDFGETNENGGYRAYAWGPRAGEWSRRGLWQVRVGDRFSTAAPWSTSVTESPWPDALAAAQAFGLDATTGVDWWLRLGPAGQSGVLQTRARGESSIHLIDRERSVTTLELGSASEIGSVIGAYQVRDRWYLGSSRAEEFQLYRVEQNKPQLVASYPLFGRVVTQLMGSVHGDGLALWQRPSGSGWYVYPIDLETFEPHSALYVPSESLGRVPPRCEPGRPGWLGVAGVPLTDSAASESNTHLDFSGGAERLRTKRLTARVVVDEAGICVDALAALSDGQAPTDMHVTSSQTDPRRTALPLTVTDPADERRWSFRCSP